MEKDLELLRKDLIALSLVPGIGPKGMRGLLDRAGSLDGLLGMTDSEIRSITGKLADPGLIRQAKSSTAVLEEEAFLEKNGITALTEPDDRYPALLKEIHDPPPVLFVKGEFFPDDVLSIAIVGSRRCSVYGLRMAEKLAYDLASRGVTVISGMARGIDSAAHAGAIKAGGRTIAVLGSGLGNIYPPESNRLASKIAENGAVVTEFPSLTPPMRSNFPRRNRVISGLSAAVVVVEANDRSGALITADLALDQGRDVYAVPGQADSASSRGTNRLLKSGAGLVTSADDILEALGERVKTAREGGSYGTKKRTPETPEEGKAFLAFEGEERVHIDVISEKSGLGLKTAETLVRMQLKGLVKAVPGGFYTIT